MDIEKTQMVTELLRVNTELYYLTQEPKLSNTESLLILDMLQKLRMKELLLALYKCLKILKTLSILKISTENNNEPKKQRIIE